MKQRILQTSVSTSGIDVVQALARAMALSGRSGSALAIELLAAMVATPRLNLQEYFVQGAWMGPSSPWKTFVGGRSNRRVNQRLTSKSADDETTVSADKYLTGLALSAIGLPVPDIRAVFAAERSFGALVTLRTAADLAGWLADGGNLPVFAKPVDGSMALGSIPMMATPAPGMVDIGDAVVPIADLAAEVAQAYPQGWLIQEQLCQPDDVVALIGPGVGTVRVVTLWEDAGPRVMYGVWRHPAVGTWVDADLKGKTNVGCALDPVTGIVRRAHRGSLFTGQEITHSVITPDLPLVGFKVPEWDQMVEICRAGHQLFPGNALLGWDIAITTRGPVISEVNANPMHMSYQRAFGRGFMHPDHVVRLKAAQCLMRRRAK